MTKILVCSDSHGAKDKMSKLFEEYDFDIFFFLGDGLQDLGLYENMDNVMCVRGNCDFFSTEQQELLKEIDGKRFLVTHGNNYAVKLGLGGLIKHSNNLNADIVLFGHTHSFVAEEVGDILYLNPGSLRNGSAMMVQIDRGYVSYKRLVI